MKKCILLIVLLLAINSYAQNFKGKAIYKTNRKTNFKISSDNNPEMNDKMIQEIKAKMEKMNQKTYHLFFDKDASIYKEDIPLAAPNVNRSSSSMIFSSGDANKILYKNIKENYFLNQTAIMGKSFLVEDNLENHEWQLSSETKNIGNYTCYKATFSELVNNVKIGFLDSDASSTSEKTEKTTTAWYTLQIPISNGPAKYQGLPGLILEINDGSQTIVCTEVVLNSKEDFTIKKPEKGKKVTQKKFLKIQKEKTKELMDRFKTRRGNADGVEIRIGG